MGEADTPKLRSLVYRLGVAQCTLWGVLYYAFAVVLPRMAADLGISTAKAVGAFSVALAISAMIAPRAGRMFDSGHASRTLRFGAFAAAVLTALWAYVPSAVALYLVWMGLGVCMAFTLYEAAYGLLTALPVDRETRARAWAQVTVFGGLASVVFVPLTQWLESLVGWRHTLLILSLFVAASGLLIPRASQRSEVSTSTPHSPSVVEPSPRSLRWIVSFMVLAVGAATVLSVMLYTNLIERGVAPELAVWVPALLGLMQLPGRVWLSRQAAMPVRKLLWLCAILQAVGLAGLSIGSSLPILMLAASAFGLGAGLLTLARPLALAAVVGESGLNRAVGLSARAQSLARAAAPYGGAAAITLTGSFALVATALALAVGLSGFIAQRALVARTPSHKRHAY